MNLRLRDPSLDFWVDVRVIRRHSRFLAVADLADVPEIGLGHSLEDAVAEAIAPIGPVAASALLRSSLRQLPSDT
jgi:hypothetical protein